MSNDGRETTSWDVGKERKTLRKYVCRIKTQSRTIYLPLENSAMKMEESIFDELSIDQSLPVTVPGEFERAWAEHDGPVFKFYSAGLGTPRYSVEVTVKLKDLE